MNESVLIHPMELLRIINSYANTGANAEQLGTLFEKITVNGTDYATRALKELNIKEKELKDINKRILKIIADRDSTGRNVALDVETFLYGIDKEFSLNQLYAELCITSKQDKDAARKAISRLKVVDRIEAVGHKSGQYRVINRNIEYTDYKNIKQIPSLDLILPLGLHKRTLFYPKSLTAIAGVTGTGKTSFALNIILENQEKYKFKYFYNAELSPAALHKKLSYFDYPMDEWRFDAISSKYWDYTNIHKQVFPDCINVIDYLEPDPNKIWTIYNLMASISENIGTGMAIILIQKKVGSDFGTGGDWSAKATSFYVALEYKKIKVVKNTYREEDQVGYDFNMIDFDIKHGCNIVANGGWYGTHNQKEKEKQKVYEKHDDDAEEGGYIN